MRGIGLILLRIGILESPCECGIASPGSKSHGVSETYRKDTFRMDLEEIGINAGNWVDSAQDRNYWRALVNAALHLRVP